MRTNRLDDWVAHLGHMLLGWLFSLFTTALVALAMRGLIGGWVMPVATLLVALGYMRLGLRDTQLQVYVFLTWLAILAASVAIAGRVIDSSYDGWGYHADALIQLFQGWNPIWDPPQLHPIHGLYLSVYPKATWILGGAIFASTGLIESAKAINLIAILIAFSFLYQLLREWRVPPGRAALVSALVALNPIVVSQTLTLLVDGFLTSILGALASALIMEAKTQKRRWLIMSMLLVAILLNIKTSAVAFAFCFLAVWGVWKISMRRDWLSPAVMVCAGLIGLFGYGFAPYSRAMYEHMNPLYPAVGPGKIDLIAEQYPTETFRDAPAMQKLFDSLGSVSDDSKRAPRLKWPGMVSLDEISRLREGTRIGGFGPWFSLMAAVGCVTLAGMLSRAAKFRGPVVWLLAGIIVSVLVHPAAWWARYVPQLYWIPLLPIVLACVWGEAVRVAGWMRYCLAGLSFIAVVNVSFFGYNLVRVVHQSLEYERLLTSLQGKSVIIDPGPHLKVARLLEERGVSFAVGSLDEGIPFGPLRRGIYLMRPSER